MAYTMITDPQGNRIAGIQRDSDGASIPENTENRDWLTYLEWLAEGNSPTEPGSPKAP